MVVKIALELSLVSKILPVYPYAKVRARDVLRVALSSIPLTQCTCNNEIRI